MCRFVRKQNDEGNEQPPQKMEDVPISGPRKNPNHFLSLPVDLIFFKTEKV